MIQHLAFSLDIPPPVGSEHIIGNRSLEPKLSVQGRFSNPLVTPKHLCSPPSRFLVSWVSGSSLTAVPRQHPLVHPQADWCRQPRALLGERGGGGSAAAALSSLQGGRSAFPLLRGLR